MGTRVITAGLIAAITVSTGCATKNLVRRHVGDINAKVDSLGKALEQTQERTSRNERRIEDVDHKVQAVDARAQAASEVAASAASTAHLAGARMDAIEKASKKLAYDLVLSENENNFKFGATQLPAEAKARIDSLMALLIQDPKNVFIEIEGHTDNVGDRQVNASIGLQRARTVQRYLYERYQIPLHKMNVISYGEEKPVASNETKSGRAQNRRVVLRIVA